MKKFLLAAAALGAAAPAFAVTAPPVLTDLTAAVDVSTISTAMLAIGAVGVTVRLVWVAVKYVRGMTKSV